MSKSILHFTNQLCLRYSHPDAYGYSHSYTYSNPSTNASKL